MARAKKGKSRSKQAQLIYVCSPFSSDIEKNKKLAINHAEYISKQGNIPVTPHLMFPFLDDTKANEREKALRMCINLVKRCDKVYIFGNSITKGMHQEIDTAIEHGIMVQTISD